MDRIPASAKFKGLFRHRCDYLVDGGVVLEGVTGAFGAAWIWTLLIGEFPFASFRSSRLIVGVLSLGVDAGVVLLVVGVTVGFCAWLSWFTIASLRFSAAKFTSCEKPKSSRAKKADTETVMATTSAL